MSVCTPHNTVLPVIHLPRFIDFSLCVADHLVHVNRDSDEPEREAVQGQQVYNSQLGVPDIIVRKRRESQSQEDGNG